MIMEKEGNASIQSILQIKNTQNDDVIEDT